MNTQEKYWLEQCRKYPDRYVICVDNDAIFVNDMENKNIECCVFSFDDYAYYFIVKLLQYFGYNAEHA